MNATPANESMQAPTAEALAGRLLRLLRQGRGWSQKEVADRMRAYGYSWNQSTVTRIESASRPLRLNELADLAILFGVPVAQFLERDLLLGEEETLEDFERKIARLEEERMQLTHMVDMTRAARASANADADKAAAELARVETSLAVLGRWHPQAAKKAGTG